jgi:hypothetical protein
LRAATSASSATPSAPTAAGRAQPTAATRTTQVRTPRRRWRTACRVRAPACSAVSTRLVLTPRAPRRPPLQPQPQPQPGPPRALRQQEPQPRALQVQEPQQVAGGR